MVVEQLSAGRQQVEVRTVQTVSERVCLWIVMVVMAWAEGRVVLLQAEMLASKAHLPDRQAVIAFPV